LSAHGPVGTEVGLPYPPDCSDPYAREKAKPVSSAYFWLIHASGVTFGSEEREPSQHQSSHQKSGFPGRS
jgi:hypothetical protein